MKAIKELLSESNGRFSSMRVMSFISLFVAMFVTIWQILHLQPIDQNTLIIWIVAAFCPKVIQKFAEEKVKNA